MQSNDKISFDIIGYVHSPYKEKFAIPRQPGLASAAKGSVTLTGEFAHPDTVRGLEQFSHIWLMFVFHATAEQGWKPLIRPPRLGGNEKVGVFGSRSTFRPNPIGMSVVKLDQITSKQNQVMLHISGLDLLDKTPIIDIKPYVSYVDSVENAKSAYAASPPDKSLSVQFCPSALLQIAECSAQFPDFKLLIEQVLSQDPRPAYRQGKADDKIYGMQLYHFNIRWHHVDLSTVEVVEITSA